MDVNHTMWMMWMIERQGRETARAD